MSPAAVIVTARMGVAAERAGLPEGWARELAATVAGFDACDVTTTEVAAALQRRIDHPGAGRVVEHHASLVAAMRTAADVRRVAHAVVLAHAAASVEAVLEEIAAGREAA